MKTQLKKDEKVILETKPHWFTLVGPFMLVLISSVICIVIGIYSGIKIYGILAALAFIAYFIYKIIQRNNNLWAVTNLRVIDEFGVFSNNTKESPLDKINNVSYRQSFWGKIFGYGNVQIQTAAEIGSTTYSSVENPKKLKDTITHMQEVYKQNQITKQATELAGAIIAGQQSNKTDVAAELERLYELKQKGILTDEEYINRKTKILNS
ncbi:MAG: PH domain-containing protein [Bacteroidia bacterium]|nr:PH domain-containing protein [Bacteroidia bacterium]